MSAVSPSAADFRFPSIKAERREKGLSFIGAQSTLRDSENLHSGHGGPSADTSLAARVREATSVYRNINHAIAAGYAQFLFTSARTGEERC